MSSSPFRSHVKCLATSLAPVRRFRRSLRLGGLLCMGLAATPAAAQITANNWGSVVAPVAGTSEAGVYAGAELFAGPQKFGADYFAGVLPNGRIVRPAGLSAQVGMDPLGFALTPDGKYLLVSDDAERGGQSSLQNPLIAGGYALTVFDAKTMKFVSRVASGPVYIGLQITGSGPYFVWASGGPSNAVKLFALDSDGKISGPTETIEIKPILPANAGFVSNYRPGPGFNKSDANGNKPPVPSNFNRTGGDHITYPAGSALSPDGKFLYVACNGDNSLAVIETATRKVVKQSPAGFFPYGVAVSRDGTRVAVANWGILEYKFKNPTYDSNGDLAAIHPTDSNTPAGFYPPVPDAKGKNPKTSSLSLFDVPKGDAANLAPSGGVYVGHPLDALVRVGDVHPCATAVVRKGDRETLYVAKANSDALALISMRDGRRLPDFDLSPLKISPRDGHKVHGSYPNALAVSPDNSRLYVAEAGLNSVAVLDVSEPEKPKLLGRIPTGWYPTGVTVSGDGKTLYVLNAKGIGEDINPKTTDNPIATGIESFADSNYIFGTAQNVDLTALPLDNKTVLGYNFAVRRPEDTSVVPLGGKPSAKIKHVFMILHENKTFDSMLGSLGAHFGPFASLTYNTRSGAPINNAQYTGVSRNARLLASAFAAGVNYYSDSEESDAGHDFASSGTASDYTEKTLNEKDGRGLLVNKNMDPEDYPEGGYIFNNAARNGVSFKDYGDLVRIIGTDTGGSSPTKLNDPQSGLLGYPKLNAETRALSDPLENAGDVSSPTQGLGQSYFLALPALAVLGGKNATGEPRLDRNYPGYNFNISDQRRALEFIRDFDRMEAAGTLPQLLHIYQPNDHTGGAQAPNAKDVGVSPFRQVADGDVALGMVVSHILHSKAYYDPATGEGSAIFITDDDAQGTMDHIHQHRTPLIVVSPYVKPGYAGKKHYSTASIVKTEELLLGLPPNNYGDLFATDLRDLFQPTYNNITADSLHFSRTVAYQPSPEGRRIWALVNRIDTSSPDRDSHRLGALARMCGEADRLYKSAAKKGRLRARAYRAAQKRLYQQAVALVSAPAPKDDD